MIDKDNEWLESIRVDLAQGIEEIDDTVQMKLALIRRQALARKTSKSIPAFLLPAAVVATACLVLTLFVYLPKQQPRQNEMIDDLDLITTSENLDLFEDLEFYEWLEAYDLPS